MNDAIMRVGIIGAGKIVETRHLSVFDMLPELRVEWVLDANAARAREIADRCQNASAIEKISDASAVDAVLLAIPVGVRDPYWEAIFENGWSVYCEKPLARSERELLAIIERANQSALILETGFIRRRYAGSAAMAVLKAKRLLDGLESIYLSNCLTWANTGVSGASYMSDPSLAGGGVLVETGTHTLDQLSCAIGIYDPVISQYEQTAVGNYGEVACQGRGEVSLSESRVPFGFRFSVRERRMNGMFLRFQHGVLYWDHAPDAQPKWLDPDLRPVFDFDLPAVGALSALDATYIAWREFIRRWRRGRADTEQFELARFSSRVVDQCYARS